MRHTSEDENDIASWLCGGRTVKFLGGYDDGIVSSMVDRREWVERQSWLEDVRTKYWCARRDVRTEGLGDGR